MNVSCYNLIFIYIRGWCTVNFVEFGVSEAAVKTLARKTKLIVDINCAYPR